MQVVSDQFGPLNCAGWTAEGQEDCALTTELCAAPDRAAVRKKPFKNAPHLY